MTVSRGLFVNNSHSGSIIVRVLCTFSSEVSIWKHIDVCVILQLFMAVALVRLVDIRMCCAIIGRNT